MTYFPSIEPEGTDLLVSGNFRYLYDFVADESESVVNYADSDTFEVIGPRPSRHGITAGIDVKVTDGNLSVNYGLGIAFKEKYYGISPNAQLRYVW